MQTIISRDTNVSRATPKSIDFPPPSFPFPPRVELKFQNFGRIALEFRLVFHNGTNSQREREREASALPGFHPVAPVWLIATLRPNFHPTLPSPSNPLPYSSSPVAMLLASNQRQTHSLSLSLSLHCESHKDSGGSLSFEMDTGQEF